MKNFTQKWKLLKLWWESFLSVFVSLPLKHQKIRRKLNFVNFMDSLVRSFLKNLRPLSKERRKPFSHHHQLTHYFLVVWKIAAFKALSFFSIESYFYHIQELIMNHLKLPVRENEAFLLFPLCANTFISHPFSALLDNLFTFHQTHKQNRASHGFLLFHGLVEMQ